MKRRFGLFGFIVLTVAVLAPATTAQDYGSQGTTASGGPNRTFSRPDQVPALIIGSDKAESSGIQLGMTTGAVYQSNVGAFSGTSQDEVLGLFRGSIELLQIRPKITWDIFYAPGVQLASALQSQNYFSNSLKADMIWQMSQHWQLQGHNQFLYTANPFDTLTVAGTPTITDPNPTIEIPYGTREVESGELDLTDQINKYDSLNFGGTVMYRNYGSDSQNPEQAQSLHNVLGQSASAMYNHRVSEKLTLGGGVIYSHLDYGNGLQLGNSGLFQVSAQYQLRPDMTVSGWIGPQYTTTKDEVSNGFETAYVPSHSWTTSAGATFGWQNLRNAVRATASRQVSDGGGVLGVVDLYLVRADYRRQVMRRWYGTLGFLYGHNTSVGAYFADRTFETVKGTVAIEHNLTRAWSATLAYSYLYEYQTNIYAVPSFSDNRVSATIHYIWGHPLAW